MYRIINIATPNVVLAYCPYKHNSSLNSGNYEFTLKYKESVLTN